MTRMLLIFYNFLIIPLSLIFLFAASFFNKKIRKGLIGRRALVKKLKREIPEKINNRPVIWVHVSSYGEYLQAKPVFDQIKRENADIFIFVTVFSPSGIENIKIQHPVDYVSYMPYDTFGDMKKSVSIIKPKVAIIVRHDIWPNFVWRLHKEQVPLFLIDASLPKHSSRLKPLFRYVNKKLFALLSGVFVIEKDEVVGFRKLGVEEAKIKIVGDTKYDQVFDRSQKREKIAPLLNHPVLQNKQVLVAGSTWPADEEIVIPAFCSVAKKVDKLLLIIAPHESQTKRITEIEHLCRQFHLKSVRWSELAKLTNDCQCLIIDQMGLLSSIYSLGKVAFVGGSFYYKIHNVLEPAVFGIPVFFGPKMTTSAEALKLLENEAAIMVTSVKQVADLLTKIFKDSVYANRYGDRAKKLVYQNTGSSRKIAELLIGNLNTFSGKGKGMGKENI